MTVQVIHGDCLSVLADMPAESVDAIVTDPPYHLTAGKKGGSGEASLNVNSPAGRARTSTGFMGKAWDGGDVAFRPETWAEVFRVLKPGGHLLAFGGTRTFHRMVCAIEDAGFEIRDQIAWLYGSGFPKSLDVSKAIDKAAGAEREIIGPSRRRVSGKPEQRIAGLHGSSTFAETIGMGANVTAPATPEAAEWAGWGTALKPAHEPIILARKPLIGTVAQNVLAHGVGGINIDACRVESVDSLIRPPISRHDNAVLGKGLGVGSQLEPAGRWPPNVLHDGSEEVLASFAKHGDKSSTRANGNPNDPIHGSNGSGSSYKWGEVGRKSVDHRDTGTAARFFYSAKAGKADRADSKHPTVKPNALMRWLVTLVTPPGGTVLDPFCGTGSTLLAAVQLGFNAIGIEADETYAADARRKLAKDAGLFAEVTA